VNEADIQSLIGAVPEEGTGDKLPKYQEDDEFSKPMMYLYDDAELKERKKE
jgi:hypothetical protein